jgi:two-component system sensor histidine kinase YesM
MRQTKLNVKIVLIILLTSMIPVTALTVFAYYHFDKIYTDIIQDRYDQLFHFADSEFTERGTGDIPAVISEVFGSDDLYQHGYLTIIDDGGATIYSSVPNSTMLAESIAANLDKLQFDYKLTKTNWTITFIVDKVYAQSDLYVVRGLMVIVIMLSFVAVLIVANHFTKRITDPLYDMMNQMEKMENGELKVNIAIDNDDEIGMVAKKFNKMAEKLREYIERYYIMDIKEQEAELTALRAQINPHYLYNTLEVIRMNAVDEDAETTAGMIENLSRQMQYTLDSSPVVLLRQELDFINDYIKLINIRYNGKIELDTNVGTLGDSLILKLSIQPLIENAYKYGLKPNGGTGMIQVLAEEEAGNLVISVLDNGEGMTKERLQEVQELLKASPEDKHYKNIGLKNVNDRLRTRYGEEYGLQITSQEKTGTVVTMKLPLQKGTDNVDSSNRG